MRTGEKIKFSDDVNGYDELIDKMKYVLKEIYDKKSFEKTRIEDEIEDSKKKMALHGYNSNVEKNKIE